MGLRLGLGIEDSQADVLRQSIRMPLVSIQKMSPFILVIR
jgi:hypothetical protein